MTDLNGKTALITGASRGIGAAMARDMAQNGAAAVLMARSAAQIDAIAGDIRAKGGRALAVTGDVARFDDVKAAADKAVDAFGSVDILVNNAGVIDPIARLDESDPGAWGSVVDINLKGPYFAVRSVLPLMLERGTGTIINISSGAATGALEGWSHYCATKAGLLSLTRCIHKEYADRGIRVFGLSPGTVATDMQVAIRGSGVNPVSQLDPGVHIPPEWVAKAATWLCSDEAHTLAGDDFSLKTDEGRQRVGLPPVAR